MKCLYYALTSILILFVCNCAKKHEQKEISVSSFLKEKIENVLSPSGCFLFALNETFPATIEEMQQYVLITAGDIDNDADIQLMLTSINSTSIRLFRSISSHYINPNLISISGDVEEYLKIPLKSGVIARFYRKHHPLARDTSVDSLIINCMQDMKKQKSVLLVTTELYSEFPENMVEVLFIDQ